MHFPTTAAAALLLAVATSAATAGIDTITVGADSSCDYYSLDRAIDAVASAPGRHRIRVARNIVQVLSDPDVIPPNVQLIGGYSNCADTTALGYTAVSVRRSPPPDMVASANRVRFETNQSERYTLTPADARHQVRPVPAAVPLKRAAR